MVFSHGTLFFTHVMDWPAGVQAKDLPALAALALEDISPFALDALAWGFCSDEASRTLFLYAACLPRIHAAGQEQWALATHVYPAFLPLLAPRVQKTGGERPAAAPERELLLAQGEVLLLERAAGSRWPQRIHAEILEDGENAQTVFAAAARLLVKAGLATSTAAAQEKLGDIAFWQLAQAKEGRRHEIRFTLEAVNGSAAKRIAAEAVLPASGVKRTTRAEQGAPERATDAPAAAAPTTAVPAPAAATPAAARGAALPLTGFLLDTALAGEEALWQADLRTEGFIGRARKSRIASLRLWYGLCAAAVVAVLLLLALALYQGLGSTLETRVQRIAAQTPEVERIRQDQDLLMRMRQFSAEPFEPFGLIGALKATKPDPVYFDSIELIGADSVVVEGQGPTVDAVNAYVRTLEQGGGFRSARQARMSLRDGVSVFTLYLQYLGKPVQEEQAEGAGQAGLAARQGAAQAGGAGVSTGEPAADGAQNAPADPLVEVEDILDLVELQDAQGGGAVRVFVTPALAEDEDEESQTPFPSASPVRASASGSGAVIVGVPQNVNAAADAPGQDADEPEPLTIISVDADGVEQARALLVDPTVLRRPPPAPQED